MSSFHGFQAVLFNQRLGISRESQARQPCGRLGSIGSSSPSLPSVVRLAGLFVWGPAPSLFQNLEVI